MCGAGRWSKGNGCLSLLIEKLEERELTVNLSKCSALGSTPGAWGGKPGWLKEPKTILDKDNNAVHARGIDICKNPIGEEIYVKTYLDTKFESIRSATQKSCEEILPQAPMRRSWLSTTRFRAVGTTCFRQTILRKLNP